jgi:hypothetical protein
MTSRKAWQRAIIALAFALLAGVYAVAWLAPAIGLFHDDAVYLETAKSLVAGHGYLIEGLPAAISQTKYPPLWPAVLALFLLVSDNAQWLKLAPLLCTAGWLILAHRLLRKMGAHSYGAIGLVLIVAASPTTVFLATHLLSEPPFALLVTASLLVLLDDRAIASGLLAGLATITRSAGLPLLVAAVLILVSRRRLRSAALFTAAATILVAPWAGWAIAHASNHPYYGAAAYASTSILTSLKASEKASVLATNALYLMGAPALLLTGAGNIYAALATFALYVWSWIRRRQLVPDLFILLYCAMLMCWAGPPARFVVPLLPLVLWIPWRAFQNIRHKELLAALLIAGFAVPIEADLERLPQTRRLGEFASSPRAPNDWARMGVLFDYLKDHTPADTIVMANLDPVFYLNTGRKAVRGFFPDGYRLYYSPSNSIITPDGLAKEIMENGVSYVALTPDRDFAESPAFHKAVEALARGGMLEPVGIPGADQNYRLLKTVSFRSVR